VRNAVLHTKGRTWTKCVRVRNAQKKLGDNIKFEHVDWIYMTQDKGQQGVLVNMAMELRIP
jgi:hypothetical protein